MDNNNKKTISTKLLPSNGKYNFPNGFQNDNHSTSSSLQSVVTKTKIENMKKNFFQEETKTTYTATSSTFSKPKNSPRNCWISSTPLVQVKQSSSQLSSSLVDSLDTKETHNYNFGKVANEELNSNHDRFNYKSSVVTQKSINSYQSEKLNSNTVTNRLILDTKKPINYNLDSATGQSQYPTLNRYINPATRDTKETSNYNVSKTPYDPKSYLLNKDTAKLTLCSKKASNFPLSKALYQSTLNKIKDTNQSTLDTKKANNYNWKEDTYQSAYPNRKYKVLADEKLPDSKLIESKRHSKFIKNNDANNKLGPPKCYIINIKTFDKITKKQSAIGNGSIGNIDRLETPKIITVNPLFREGSLKDVAALKNTLEEFNINCKIYEDLRLKELKILFEKISKKDFSKHSAIMIFFMSHGGSASELYAKDAIFHLSDITAKLFDNRYLCDKPKMLFIEACRGKTDPRMSMDTNNSGSDILIFYAAYENYVSFTDKQFGSYFTQSLCEKLHIMGKTKDIRDICNDVIADVFSKCGKIQTPTLMTSFTKSYCLGDYCHGDINKL